MSVDYEYDFTKGLYRARIKTTYKRDDMSMSDNCYSNYYPFESIWGNKRVTVFDNGVFNSQVSNVTDITHRQIIKGGSNEWATVEFIDNHLSQYYLTDWCLVTAQTSAREFYQDGLYIKKYHAAGVSGICHFIPINRKYNVKSIEATARLTEGTGPWDIFGIGCAYIDSNNNIHYGWTGLQYPSYGPTDWQDFSYTVPSSYPYIDYIMLNGCDGTLECRLIELLFKGGPIE